MNLLFHQFNDTQVLFEGEREYTTALALFQLELVTEAVERASDAGGKKGEKRGF